MNTNLVDITDIMLSRLMYYIFTLSKLWIHIFNQLLSTPVATLSALGYAECLGMVSFATNSAFLPVGGALQGLMSCPTILVSVTACGLTCMVLGILPHDIKFLSFLNIVQCTPFVSLCLYTTCLGNYSFMVVSSMQCNAATFINISLVMPSLLNPPIQCPLSNL